MLPNQELIDRLNRMADSLYYVAGTVTMLSQCDKTAVEAGCECEACSALARVHECMNEMERIVALCHEG